MSATCCCTELPQKLPHKLRIAPLLALSIQPYKVAATASTVVDTLAKCCIFASFEVEGHAHLLPRLVGMPPTSTQSGMTYGSVIGQPIMTSDHGLARK